MSEPKESSYFLPDVQTCRIWHAQSGQDDLGVEKQWSGESGREGKGTLIMTHVPMPEGVRLSTELLDWLRLSIADAVVVSGRMEQEIIEILLDSDGCRSEAEAQASPSAGAGEFNRGAGEC